MSSVIRRVAAFLGKTVTEDQVSQLCDHLSFEKMKENPAINRQGLVERAEFLQLGSGNGNFFRAGKVGEGRQIMKPEILRRFQKLTDEKFANVGLTF